MAEPEQSRRCPKCHRALPVGAFYATSAECKDCKRDRSQRNRALQARKIAAFERFVDVLITLADGTAEPSGERGSARKGTAA